MARVIVCGYMIRHPVAGNVLAYYHYVLGLHRLGHEVVYLEESGWPRSCYDPVAQTLSDCPKASLRTVHRLLASFRDMAVQGNPTNPCPSRSRRQLTALPVPLYS